MNHLQAIFGSLKKHEVKYLLCGGVAVNLYGIPRMTADLDVIIEMTGDNIGRFEMAIKEHGYKKNLFVDLLSLLDSSLRQKYIKEKNLIAYSYSSENFRSMMLDVLIDVPVTFNDCWERRTDKLFAGIPVNILSIADLIVMKEYANREQDQKDIINLKKFNKL